MTPEEEIYPMIRRANELVILQEQKHVYNPDLGISHEDFSKFIESEKSKNSSELTNLIMEINILAGQLPR
jgi:hypothetical protein